MAGYVKFRLPNVGPAIDLNVVITPERVQHGEYLANHIAVCMDCHSTRDWTRFGGPMIEGTLGKGGEYFGEEVGIPGKIFSKNITPYNLNSWTDGEIFRAISSGVSKNGDALFPIMPYDQYGKMDKEDVIDIIAYLRTLSPIKNETPKHDLNFPMNFIVNTIPQPAQFITKPSKSDTVQYGAYLVHQASCLTCHTPETKGKPEMEFAYGGNRVFKMPNGEVRSANITPDLETGIGNWTAETFVSKFKLYADSNASYKIAPDQVNSVMPWGMYSGMDTSDLRSIYAYLRTIKPIKNAINHFSKSTHIQQ